MSHEGVTVPIYQGKEITKEDILPAEFVFKKVPNNLCAPTVTWHGAKEFLKNRYGSGQVTNKLYLECDNVTHH